MILSTALKNRRSQRLICQFFFVILLCALLRLYKKRLDGFDGSWLRNRIMVHLQLHAQTISATSDFARLFENNPKMIMNGMAKRHLEAVITHLCLCLLSLYAHIGDARKRSLDDAERRLGTCGHTAFV